MLEGKGEYMTYFGEDIYNPLIYKPSDEVLNVGGLQGWQNAVYPRAVQSQCQVEEQRAACDRWGCLLTRTLCGGLGTHLCYFYLHSIAFMAQRKAGFMHASHAHRK